MAQTTYPLNFLGLDRGASDPLHKQLCVQLRDMILEGSLTGEGRLPSIRALAKEHGIARNTVVSAYDQLTAEGLIEGRRGSGTWVVGSAARLPGTTRDDAAEGAMPPLSRRGEMMIRQPRVRGIPGRPDFHPGTPELATFPFKTWGRLLAQKSRYGGNHLFGYHDITGLPELRERMAEFLVTTRRVRCTADQVVITMGGSASVRALACARTARG